MWGIFFVLFGWSYVGLLLGALAVYWGVSSLRGTPRTPDPDSPVAAAQGPGNGPGQKARPQVTAAVTGLVTASITLAMVAGLFTAQFVYRDYYTCRSDALTATAQQNCDHLLPAGFIRAALGQNNR
jgi:hypothetical protein